MDKFLTESKKDIIAVADQKGLGEVIKPLSREIHLFDTYIAGTSYLKDPKVLEKIKCGDKLLLQREDNKFDNNAILASYLSVRFGSHCEKRK